MSSSLRAAALAVLLCGGALSAHAATGDAELAGCVDLSPDHEVARFGSQYLLVKDGDAHYRLGFGGSCGAIAMSTQVQVRARGKDGRICPQGTNVLTKRGSCAVRGVAPISAEKYDTYARRRR